MHEIMGNTGINAYMPKGTTSKEMEETSSYGKKLFFMVKFPEFLGTPTYKHFRITGLLPLLESDFRFFFCINVLNNSKFHSSVI